MVNWGSILGSSHLPASPAPSPRSSQPPVFHPSVRPSSRPAERIAADRKGPHFWGKLHWGRKNDVNQNATAFVFWTPCEHIHLTRAILKKAHQSLKHLVMAHGLCDVEPDGATTTTADRQWQLQQELHGSLEDYQEETGICFNPAWPYWWDVQFIPILKTPKPKPFGLNHKTFKHELAETSVVSKVKVNLQPRLWSVLCTTSLCQNCLAWV